MSEQTMRESIAFRQLSDISSRYEEMDKQFASIVSSLRKLYRKIKGAASVTLAQNSATYSNLNEVLGIEMQNAIFYNEDGTQVKLRKHMTTIQRLIPNMKVLSRDLAFLREQTDKRGFGIFKCGNVKQRMDEVVSMKMINELRDNMKSCLTAFQNVNHKFTRDELSPKPIFDWLKEHNKKTEMSHSLSTHNHSKYEVIYSI